MSVTTGDVLWRPPADGLGGRLVDGVQQELDGREHEVLVRRDRALRELLAVKARPGPDRPTGAGQ